MNYAPRTLRELAALKDILYGSDSTTADQVQDRDHDHDQEQASGPADQRSRKDHLTDKLLERLFAATLPVADTTPAGDPSSDVVERLQDQKNRPAFSVSVMARNFSRLNSRIGVVFKLQYRVLRVITWRNSSHTFSTLAVYSFCCLYPFLLAVLPIAVIVIGFMVPAFVKRHPPPPSPLPSFPVPSEGPPLADAAEFRPVPELSRDFLMNMRDIQNAMDDFTRAYDKIVHKLARPTSFKDEQYSSAVYLALVLAGVITFLAAPYLPWRHVFLALGWIVISVGHPNARQVIKSSHELYMSPQEKKLSSLFELWVEKDIVLDAPPEVRHVEIFELQRRGTDVAEWETWLFSSSPYEPNSPAHVGKQRPQGVRFLDEVNPPPGWKFGHDSVWKLDLQPLGWVQQRSVVDVNIEHDSKWVYDCDHDDGRKGEWRRRRWCRTCERQPETDLH
ncbi:integral peroxisomal membrane peroxin-domain-containing protein [Lipomyces japonicus]|uniref:integral peroxisomal membrane peroxin-domain-containing protein n=1 Tax=Lipomyces japonicus TaxID=56871 RepID=UPI0034CE9AB9